LLIGGYVPAVARRIAAWGDGYMAPGGGDRKHVGTMATDPQALEKMVARDNALGRCYLFAWAEAFDQASGYINANYGYNPELAARLLRGIQPRLRPSKKRQGPGDMGVDEFILRLARKTWTRWSGWVNLLRS